MKDPNEKYEKLVKPNEITSNFIMKENMFLCEPHLNHE